MKFCPVCENMLYIKLNDQNPNNLEFYCRNCDHKESQTTLCVLSSMNTLVNRADNYFGNIINEYTKYDPTLPRVYNLLCPNEECPSNKALDGETKEPSEALYLRYDHENMKYVYLCCVCNAHWVINPLKQNI